MYLGVETTPVIAANDFGKRKALQPEFITLYRNRFGEELEYAASRELLEETSVTLNLMRRI